MPTCDAYIPEGALPQTAERELLSKVTDTGAAERPADPYTTSWDEVRQ